MAKKSTIIQGGTPLRYGDANRLDAYALDSILASEQYHDLSYSTPEVRQWINEGAPLQKASVDYDYSTTPLGESQYDDPNMILNPFNYESNDRIINESRAQNQPWYTKLANGIAKGVITAGTTLVDGTIGMIAGAGSAGLKFANTGNFWDSALNGWDNPIFKAMEVVSNWSEKNLPNYYSEEEQTTPWWQNILTANFIGDKFLKNIGFSVGAYYTGKIWTLPLAKGFDKLFKADDALMAVETANASGNVAKAGNILGSSQAEIGLSRGTTALVGSFISSVNEGGIEAIKNSTEFFKTRAAEINNMYEQELAKIYEAQELGLMTQDQVNDAIKQETYERDNALTLLRENVTKMGNADFLLNIPILMASNLWQFGKLYAKGFENQVTKGIAGNIKEGFKNTLTTGKGVAKGISNALAEGTEEISQRWAQDVADTHYGNDVMRYYKDGMNAKQREEAANWLADAGTSLNKTWNDGSAWEEFFIGALTGALGIPTVGSSSSNRLGGKYFGLEGGIYGEIKENKENIRKNNEIIEYLNSRTGSNISNLEAYYTGLVRHSKLDNDMIKAAVDDDKKTYKDSEYAQLINDIDMFSRAGRLEDLRTFIQHAGGELSDADAEAIQESTTSRNFTEAQMSRIQEIDSILSTYKDQLRKTNRGIKQLENIPGISITQDNMDNLKRLRTQQEEIQNNIIKYEEEKAAIVQDKQGEFHGPFVDKNGNKTPLNQVKATVEKNKNKIVEAIDLYSNTLEGIRNSNWGKFLDDEEVRNAAYLISQVDNWRNRINDMGQQLKPVVREVLSGLQNKLKDLDILESLGEEDSNNKVQKAKENISRDIELLEDLLSRDNEFIGSTISNYSDETIKMFKDILNDKDAKINPVTRDTVLPILDDVQALGKAIDIYNSTLSEYMLKPLKLREDMAKVSASQAKSEREAKVNNIKNQLSNISSLQEFENAVNNIEDQELAGEVIDSLVSEGNEIAKNYKETVPFKNKVYYRLEHTDIEEADQEEAQSLINDARALLDKHFEQAQTPNDVRNSNSVALNDINILRNEGEEESSVQARHNRAYKLASQIIESVSTEEKEAKAFKRKEVSTNDQAQNNQPSNNTAPKVTAINVPIGNITSDELEEEAGKANDGYVAHTSSKDKPYYHSAIWEYQIEDHRLKEFGEIANGRFSYIYQHLKKLGAFEYINSGKLKEGSTVLFVTDPNYDKEFRENHPEIAEEYGDHPTIFMAVKDSATNKIQIIGVLPSTGPHISTLRKNIENELKDVNTTTNNVESIDIDTFIKEIRNLITNNATIEEINNYIQKYNEYIVYNDKEVTEGEINTVFSRATDSRYSWEDRLHDFDAGINFIKEFLAINISSATNSTVEKTEGYLVSKYTTNVSKIMGGKVLFGDSERVLKEIPGIKGRENEVIFGVMVGRKGGDQTIQVSNKNINYTDIIQPSDTSDKYDRLGRLYLLIPLANGKYFPTAVRVAHYNKEEEGNTSEVIKKQIDYYINKLSEATSQEDVKNIIKEFSEVLYLGDININLLTSKTNGGERTDLVIETLEKDDDGNIVKEEKNGKPVYKTTSKKEVFWDSKSKEGKTDESPLEERKRKIKEVLLELNLPYQVSLKTLNSGNTNKDLINYGVLTSNIVKATSVDNWFVTDYFDDAGNLKQAMPPQSRAVYSNLPLNSQDTVSEEVEIQLGSNTFYVDFTKGTYRINNETTKKFNKIYSEEVFKELYNIVQNVGAYSNNRVEVEYQKGDIHTFVRIEDADGNVKWLDTNTARYATESMVKYLNERYKGKKDGEIAQKEKKALEQLLQDQEQVEKNGGIIDRDDKSYKIKDSSGEVIEYQRLHSRIDSIKGPQFNTVNSDKSSLKAGQTVDDIVREFFNNPNKKPNRPKAIAINNESYEKLYRTLRELYNRLSANGETIYANNIVLFHEYEINGEKIRIAGEVDLITIDKNGKFRIYDIKTSKYNKWDGNELASFYVNVTNDKVSRSTQLQHTYQLGSYKHLFESKYGVPVEEIIEIPFQIEKAYRTSTILNITSEPFINLTDFYNTHVSEVKSIVPNTLDTINISKDDDDDKGNPPAPPSTGGITGGINTSGIRRKRKFRKLTSTKYEIFDKEKELAWLDRVLPQMSKEGRVQFAEGLIDVGERGYKAWGQFCDGILTLSNVAAKGTTYHEAFHVVFNMLTSEEKRQQLFEEAREKWGEEYSELELEELMAEDFREYVESQGTYKPKGLGNRILNFFKNLWYKIVGFKSVGKYLDSYYRAIDSGKYAKEALNNNTENRYREEQVSEEIKEIKERAIANGTFMKAPNGKDTNLTERQWLQVRTTSFKDWFGDWERAANIIYNKGIPGLFNEDTDYKLLTELEKTLTYTQAKDAVNLFKEIRKEAAKLGHVPTKKEFDIADTFARIGLFKYITTEHFAADIKEDVQFDLDSDYNKAQIDLVKLRKQYPELNLEFNTINRLNNEGKTIFDTLSNSYYINTLYTDVNSTNDVSKVVDENGEPLVVYHGTLEEFTVFDFAKLGEATGKGFYTDHITGEEIPIDSNSAFFFTDNKTAASSYKNLAIWRQNNFRAAIYQNLASVFLNNPYLRSSFDEKQKEAQKDFIDNVLSPYLGFNVREQANKIIGKTSKLSYKKKKELGNKFKEMARKIKELPNAQIISNQENSIERNKKELKFLKANKQALLTGKDISYFKDDKILLISSGFGRWEKGEIYVTIGRDKETNKYYVVGIPNSNNKIEPGTQDITDNNFDTIIEYWEKGIKQNEEFLNNGKKLGHYNRGNVLSVFLNIKNPLEHNYNGSAFPDSYIINAAEGDINAAYYKDSDQLKKPLKINGKKVPTEYIAARQVRKAKKDGNDGVIYKNLYDPFKMSSYGIFDANQVKSATDNIGTYDPNNNDIRYRLANEDGTIEKMSRTPLESKLKESRIIYAHPSIGTSTLAKKSNKILDWNSIRKNTKQSIEDAWSEAKMIANRDNKILIVSDSKGLNDYMNEFDLFLNVPRPVFIERNKGTHPVYSVTQKELINHKLFYQDSNKVYTTDKYLSELFKEAFGPSWETLTKDEENLLKERGYTKEIFDERSQEERDKILMCTF